jgi:hypothetical protein
MMFGPGLLMGMFSSHQVDVSEQLPWLPEMIPIGMFILCLLSVVTSAGDAAIHFTRSEVDFMFPAPISRRQLLVYKIVNSLGASVFIGMVAAIPVLPYVRSWYTTFIGITLAFLFINGICMCVQLLGQTVSQQAFTKGLRVALTAIGVLLALAMVQVVMANVQWDWEHLPEIFRGSLGGRMLLTPFNVFNNIVWASRLFPDFVGWSTLGAIMVIAIFAVAISLDANFLEAADRISQRIYARATQMTRQGPLASMSRRKIMTSRMPQLPWWSGAGPIARRQLLQLNRRFGGQLLIAMVVGLGR